MHDFLVAFSSLKIQELRYTREIGRARLVHNFGMHTSDAQPKRRDPPRRRFDADVVLNDDDDDDVIGGEGVDGMRALRAPNNAFPSSRFFANETNDANDAKPPHHRRRERREHDWRTTSGGTAATVAESLKVSKLEVKSNDSRREIRV